MSAYANAPVPMIVRGEGAVHLGHRTASATSTGCPACSSCRPGTAGSELAEAAAKQAARARVLPALVLRAPDGDRAGRAAGRPRARRPEPGLLHHRRRRGRRDGVEARQAVLQADRQADQAQGDRRGHRLPRHPAGRAVDHRHPGDQGRRSSRWSPARIQVPNTNFYRAPEHGDDLEGVRPLGRRPDRARPSSSRARTRSPPSSSSRCRTPAAASRRRPATSSGSARSATSYDVLLVSDEVICAFGRLGDYVRRRSGTATSPTSSPAPRA